MLGLYMMKQGNEIRGKKFTVARDGA